MRSARRDWGRRSTVRSSVLSTVPACPEISARTQKPLDSVTNALAVRVLGANLKTQPAASSVTTELSSLIGNLCTTNSCTTTKGTLAVAAAACAAALGSSDMLIN